MAQFGLDIASDAALQNRAPITACVAPRWDLEGDLNAHVQDQKNPEHVEAEFRPAIWVDDLQTTTQELVPIDPEVRQSVPAQTIRVPSPLWDGCDLGGSHLGGLLHRRQVLHLALTGWTRIEGGQACIV